MVCIDPYLTDSVAEKHGEAFRRKSPPKFQAPQITDVKHILLTHAHDDHTDLSTLLPMLAAAPDAVVIAPLESRNLLLAVGVQRRRLMQPCPSWVPLGHGMQYRSTPAAHPFPEQDSQGNHRCIGYQLRWEGGSLYHSGDTQPHEDVLKDLAKDPPPEWAFLPVNERNVFREKVGIIGNMSVREAVTMADHIGARRLVPLHWDMFGCNDVSPEEIALVHQSMRARVALHVLHPGQEVNLVASSTE